MAKGLVVIISGASSVGKGAIRDALLADADLSLFKSVSMTTRPAKEGEVDGRDYYFVTHKEFADAVKNKALLEYTEFNGYYYGIPKNQVQFLVNMRKNVLIEVEAKGAKAIKEKYPDSITIFIAPSSLESLEKQIRERREESEEIVQERLAKAKKELNLIGHYKFVVNNEDARLAGELCALIIRRMI